MDPSQSSTATLKSATASSDLCYEIVDQILSFLPRSYFNSKFDPAIDNSILKCSGVCMNWHTVARRSAYFWVELKNEEEARRFLAALVSNASFAERNPGWPLMNSTRSLDLGDVSGLFSASLILSSGDTAAHILRMLTKIEEFDRDYYPMSFEEVSAVSKNLVSLRCMNGFDFDTAQVDISSLIFPCLERVVVKSEKNSDMQFITTVLENSIPHGRGFLKSLRLRLLRAHPTTNSSVDYFRLSTSLIKVIKV
jgi:hypothetical protein